MMSNDSVSFVMWKCNGNGGGDACNFTQSENENLLEEIAPRDEDACNKYPNCSTCIGATGKTPGLSCGWCLGANLIYGKTNTTFKCGGWETGKGYNFTCPAEFRTSDCSGYSCDWIKKVCTSKPNGDFPTMKSCNDTCGAVTKMQKCNV